MSVAFVDTFIAILAGVAIFPAVFSFGISPAEGPNLVFITLPNIFIQMKAGYIFALMFFFLLVVAALTSTISILEVVVAYFTEELKMKRWSATVLASLGVGILGILCSVSLSEGSKLAIGERNLFGFLEHLSSNIFLPLGGLLIVVFVAWFFGRKKLKVELSSNGMYEVWYFKLYLFIIRFIAPLAIAMVFLYSIGIIG